MTREPAHHVPLQGQPNFRDLGGYETADGRTVKPGLLYRSGELGKLTDEDLVTLQDLGIKSVVDFRSEEEVAWRGADRLPAGAQYVPLRIEPGNLGPVLFEAVKTGDGSLLPDNLLADTNRAVIRDAAGQISDLFKALSDPSNLPLVLHCTHGKDRAGVASAILLMALGVAPEVAEKDYLKSNEYRRKENEVELAELGQVVAASQGVDPSDVDLSKFSPLFYVEPSYFEATLDEIRKQYGSFERYLETGLGIDESQLQDMCERLTGPAS